MENVNTAVEQPVFHRAQVGVECPRCHWKQLIEVNLDQTPMDNPLAREIHAHLQAWMASHCPDHLNAISTLSRN